MANLWPASTSVIGVYDEPPPDGQDVIESTAVDAERINEDFLNRELLKTARVMTRAKDWLAGLTP